MFAKLHVPVGPHGAGAARLRHWQALDSNHMCQNNAIQMVPGDMAGPKQTNRLPPENGQA